MSVWFFWLLAGIVFVGLELVIPGLVIIFFGFGAICTALLSLIPFVGDYIWLQALIFVVCSVLSLVILRRKFKPIFQGTVFDTGSNKTTSNVFAEVIEDVHTTETGRIKYKGTTWNALSLDETIPAGSRVKVVRKDGMTYIVQKS